MSIKYVLNIAIDVTRLHEMLKFKVCLPVFHESQYRSKFFLQRSVLTMQMILQFIMQEEIVNDDLNSLRKVSLIVTGGLFGFKLIVIFTIARAGADNLRGNGYAEVERISPQNSPTV